MWSGNLLSSGRSDSSDCSSLGDGKVARSGDVKLDAAAAVTVAVLDV